MSALRVLFLCTGNSARSIIAEALLKHAAHAGEFDVHSAGIEPKGVNPLTLRVLAEAGVDAAWARSKHVDEFAGEAFDYVITVCDQASTRCPAFPGGTRRLHWSVPDPAAVAGDEAERLGAFRRTVEDMRARTEDFAATAAR